MPGIMERVFHVSSYTRLLSALYLATFLIRMSFGLILITLPVYLIHLEASQYGLLAAAAPVAELFTVLLMGTITDRYGRKMPLLLGLMAAALSLSGIALTRDIYLLFAVNCLHGVGSGAILVSSLALLADYVPKEHRGREIGMFDGVNLAGWGAGFLLGGVLSQALEGHLAWTFVIAGYIAIGGFIYGRFNITEPTKRSYTIKNISGRHILAVFKQRGIMLLIAPWLVIYVLIGAMLAFAPFSGTKEYGLAAWQVGAGLFGGCIFIMLTQRFYGALSDRIGRTKVMAIGVTGLIGALVLFSYLYLTTPDAEDHPGKLITSLTHNIPLMAGIGVFGMMLGAFAPAALASLADEAHQKRRGVTMSLYSMVIALGQIIGPIIAGFAIDIYGGIGMVVFLSICGALMVVFLGIRGMSHGIIQGIWEEDRHKKGESAKQASSGAHAGKRKGKALR